MVILRLIQSTVTSFILLGLLSMAMPAQAQWSDIETNISASGRAALVKSDNDARLSIWLDKENILFAQFDLAPGLLAFDEKICPTFQIDLTQIKNLSSSTHQCSVAEAHVRFQVTQVQNNQIDSPMLLQFMNGSRVTVRYRLKYAGYGAETFSLKGSKQALKDALGDGITVNEAP